MNLGELRNEVYLRLKWHLAFLAGALLLVLGSFFTINLLDDRTEQMLRAARGDLQNAQTALDQIEQEEATIIEYIGRYEDIAAAGMVAPKDRLLFREQLGQIRARNQLFPFSLDLQPEKSYTLPYDTSFRRPGEPVDIDISPMDISLPLLHENDLASLLDELLNMPNLLLPKSCSLSPRTRDRSQFLRLAQHLNANCSFIWYTFTVHGKEEG